MIPRENDDSAPSDESSQRAFSDTGTPRSRLAFELAGGTRLAAVDFGGTGPATLAVHGAGLNALCFAPLAAALEDQLHLIGVDLSGHGRSQPAPPIDWSVFVDDVVTAASAIEGPLFGLGHSLGATALLGAAAGRPGLFTGLFCYEPIVIDAAMPDRPPSGANAEGARRRRTRFSSRLEARERFSSRPPFDAFDPAALSGYLEDGLTDADDGSVVLACAPGTEATIYETAADFDVLGLLSRVGCPVTVAFGEKSDVMSLAGAEMLTVRLPFGRVVELAGLGHFGPFIGPLAVGAAAITAQRAPEA